MCLGLPESLAVLVRNKYKAAKTAGALTLAESQLALVPIGGVRFQLRYCPSLASKPAKQSDGPSTPKKRIDPFVNPDPQLLVTKVPNKTNASHLIVLNKFPIIQNHFILATSSDALKQDQFLDQDDLIRTFECLKEWESSNDGKPQNKGRLFAFFNSGDHSGASQPHRHIQLLPVEDMCVEREGKEQWRLLMDDILLSPKIKFCSYEFHMNPSLPFVHFGLRLTPESDAQELWTSYSDLLKAAIASVRHFRHSFPEELPLNPTEDRGCPISYNLAMSTSGMVICARKREGQDIKRADGSIVDTVALNGTLLGGTLMVKNQELFDLIRTDAGKLSEVLRGVGIPAGSGHETLKESDLIESTNTLKFTL